MEASKSQERIRYVCTHCGGSDLVFSANSYWDEGGQVWTHEEDDAKPYCNGCGGETSFGVEVIETLATE